MTAALVVGSDRGLWLRPVDGGSRSWRPLGGEVRHGPAAVSAGATTYAFVVGTDGGLHFRTLTDGTWSGWAGLGGSLTSSPAAASLGDGHVRVFGRGGDGSLFSRELRNGAWSAWTWHGGYLTGPPAATARPDDGVIEVLVRGQDGFVFAQELAAGVATAPFARREVVACSALVLPGARAGTDPGSAVFLDNRSTPRLLRTGGSTTLGGGVISTPAVTFAGGHVVLVGTGEDHALWLYDGRPGRSGWVSLGGYIP